MKFLYSLLLILCSFYANAQFDVYSPALPFTDAINSKYYEKSPILHPNGNQLYFVRCNDPSNMGGTIDQGDIWYSQIDSLGYWKPPVNVGSQINNKGINTIIGFLNQGKYMVLAEQYGDKAQFAPKGISISEFRNGKWQKPINLDIPYFVKKSNYINGSVSSDGTTLILSLQSFGSYGVEDLYVSELQRSGKWGELKNLGNTINTPFQELTGYLSTNKDYLIFSSNGHPGIGSFDIWVSKRRGNGWKKWEKPVLLNDFVNSQGSDFDFHYLPNSEYGFFTSTRNSDGYGDIKQVKVQQDTLAKKVTMRLAVNEYNFKGKVTDAKSGRPLDANLVFNQKKTRQSSELNASVFGEFSLIVEDDEFIEIVVDKVGYLPVDFSVDIASLSEDSIFQVKLEPLNVGNKVKLDHILFERASDEFLSGSETQLDLLVRMMKENPKVKIFLEGHTDRTGNAKLSIILSQERVDAVRSYLVSHGIKGSRVNGKGFGGTKPIADNSDEETRKLNRRVEFRITAN